MPFILSKKGETAMENKVKMSKTTEVKDLNPELYTKKLADSVIMNAKEIISTGLRGKETKKIIPFVPVSILLRTPQKDNIKEGWL